MTTSPPSHIAAYAAYAAYAEHDDARPTFMEYTQTTNDLFTFSDGNIKINQCAIKIANLLRLGKKIGNDMADGRRRVP